MTELDPLTCPHGARCGGCAFLGVPYAEQLELKQASIERVFAHYREEPALPIARVAGAQPTHGYRTRAKLVFGAGGELGLFERDSHAVVDIPECRVLAPELARVAAAARHVVRSSRTPLDGLDLRVVDDGVLVTLIAAQGTPRADLEQLSLALCAASPEVRSVAASFREPGAATVLGTGHLLLHGAEALRHHLLAARPYHLAAHGAFTQAHPGQANAAHDAIERALTELGAKRVLELYAGSGALSLRLSQSGFRMTAVEAFAPALAYAEQAAREQRLELCTRSGSAERVLRELSAERAAFDAILVNPPRRGLSVEVRLACAALNPQAILYMSCEPKTLARDLSQLKGLGYAAQGLWPFDMIPHSAAVESLVVLRQSAPPLPKILFEDARCLAVLKSGYEPVTQGAGGGGSLLERVRRLPGASAATPLSAQRLDSDSSGVCWFARDPSYAAELGQAFYDGTQSFVGLVRGVSHKRGRIRRPVREQRRVISASTRYLREAVSSGHSRLTIWPERSTPLQIRQLLVGVGHPLLGDTQFGDPGSNTFFEHRHGLDRSFLHCSAVTLSFASGPITVEAPLPGELLTVLAALAEQATPKGE